MTINQVALSNTFNEFRTTFNDAANTVNSLQAGTGNSNVNFLTVSGGVSSNLIPSANVTYDLGSSSSRWNDLYLSGTTVYLGDAELKVQSGQFKVVIGADEVFTASNTGQSVSNTIVANNVTINENLTVTGNLTVEGTQTILNVSTLNVEDKNILIANGAVDAAAANGAGITIDGASATMLYLNSGDKFAFNKDVDLGTKNLTANGITATSITANGSNLTFLNAANLSSGTIPDARFPATLPASNGVNLTFLNASNLGTGTVAVERGGTGITSFGTGVATFLQSPTSANLASAVTDETGSGSLVFNQNFLITTARETVGIDSNALTGTVNFDAISNSIKYYTTNSSGNWTLNLRGNSGTTLNSIMNTGESLTIAYLATQGSTAYRQTAMTIDGTSVTPKWQGGTAPTAGNANSIDIYNITVVKTASATFTVFAAQTKFA